jgi:microsomal dipeptidase-like Zn-dependent dipeptidase
MIMDRRDFLLAAGRSLGALAATNTASWFLGCRPACGDQFARPPAQQGHVLADLHAHPLLNSWNKLSPIAARNPDLASAAQSLLNKTQITWRSSHQAGIDMLCVGHFNMFDEWITMPTDPSSSAPGNTVRMMNLLEEDLCNPANQPYARIVHNAKELENATRIRPPDPSFKTAVVHCIEGGHALGGDISRLDDLARRGLAMVTVTHFFHKGIGSAGNSFPFFPDASSLYSNVGLSDLGKALVRRLAELGLIIDVSHGTRATIEDILREVACPLVASHASALTLGDHPYSLQDEHISQIAKNGGIIGVILMPYWLSNYSTEAQAVEHGSLNDVLRSIVYIAKIAGVDRVGIGSDFAGYIPGPKDMTCLAQIDRLRRMLLQEFSGAETDRLMAENVIDFFIKNWHYNRV